MTYEGKKRTMIAAVVLTGISARVREINERFTAEMKILHGEMAKSRAVREAIEKSDKENRVIANRENVHRMKARGKKTDFGKLTVRSGKNRDQRRKNPR